MKDLILYRQAQECELKKIAELLTESMNEDPFNNFLVGDYKKNNLLFHMHYTNVKTYFKSNKCFVGIDGEKVVSAVLLKEKGNRESGFFDFILSGGLKVIFKSSITHVIKMLKVLEEAKEALSLHENNKWYLDEIAVDKSRQGCNIGSEMIQKCIVPYVSKSGGGELLLITNTEKNRCFYKKNGFKEFNEIIIKRNNKSVPNWSFKIEI